MPRAERGVRILCAVTALAFSYGLVPEAAQGADEKAIVMKISLPTINENVHEYAKHLAARVEKDSGGRIKPEVYPASQLGSIPRQIEGTQFGAIQCAIIPPEFFAGIDERFEILAAPGLINSMENGFRTAADPQVLKLMLGLGASKGLYGAALFSALPSYTVSRTAIRHLADLKGKKIRILASEFQTKAFERLGVTPVAMTLGDVLPAVQQGTIDGAVSGIPVFTSMHFQDAAKYVTTTGQPYIFIIVELNRKWHDSLPKDLQQIVDKAAAEESVAINQVSYDFWSNARKEWVAKGGELIDLPPEEQSAMMATMASAAEEVSQEKSDVAAAYKIVADAAKRTR
jgi:TRAP-type transport system periplasmic protein